MPPNRYNPLTTGMLWPKVRQKAADGTILFAVSGGSDSIAMLYLALPPQDEHNKVIIGYIHHGTGAHADEALDFVRDIAAKLNLQFCIERIDIPDSERKEKGFEASARLYRYQALEKIAMDNGCPLILTGHTEDDQAESMLLYLMRGAGIRGLIGARESRELLYRPLLNYSRQELQDFLEANQIPFLDDPSNTDITFTRNRIRNVLRPMLIEQFGEGAWKNIAQSTRFLSQAEEALRAQAEDIYSMVAGQSRPYWLFLDTAQLFGYLNELQVYVIRMAYDHVSEINENKYLPRKWLRKIYSFLHHRTPGAILELPNNIVLHQTSDGVIFDGCRNTPPVEWELPGTITLADGTILSAERRRSSEFSGINPTPGLVEWLDAERVGDRLTVRPWQPGDRMEPFGREGHKTKVKKLAHGSYQKRQGPIWIAEKDGEIIYIAGARIAHSYAIHSESQHAWRLTCSSWNSETRP